MAEEKSTNSAISKTDNVIKAAQATIPPNKEVEITALFPVYYIANGVVREWTNTGDIKTLSIDDIKADITCSGVLSIFKERLSFDEKVRKTLGI